MSETNTAPATATLAYGDKYKIDLSSLPEASLRALLSRGLTHYMGSEQASKVTSARKAAEEAAAEAAKAAGGDEAAIAAAIASAFGEAEAEAAKVKFQDEAWGHLVAGTMGGGARGPRGTAVETVMRQIIVADITTKLKAAGLTVPKGKDTIKLGEQAFTLSDLIDRAMARDGERFRKEAEAEMKARERRAAKALADAKASGATGLDALGL